MLPRSGQLVKSVSLLRFEGPSHAPQEGWRWIGVTCATCRYHVLMPFKLLRMRTGERELAKIKPRLYCQRCGFPPDTIALARMATPADRPNTNGPHL